MPIAAFGYAADLASKEAALAFLDPQHPPVLLGGLLRLQLVRNPGAAFGMGSGMTVFLSLLAIVALAVVVFYAIPRILTIGHSVAVGLILSGILGNLTDRLFRPPGPLRGHVIDMLQLPYFAIFNVADICITSAAALMIWFAFRSEKASEKAK